MGIVGKLCIFYRHGFTMTIIIYGDISDYITESRLLM